MALFTAVLSGRNGHWAVRFVDVPECTATGRSPEDAISEAGKALRRTLSAKTTPHRKARSLRAVVADGTIAPNEALVCIPLSLDAGRTVRVSLTMDAGLLDAIDREAERREITRSAFLASAAREKISQLR